MPCNLACQVRQDPDPDFNLGESFATLVNNAAENRKPLRTLPRMMRRRKSGTQQRRRRKQRRRRESESEREKRLLDDNTAWY
jgi:hypothetical protein